MIAFQLTKKKVPGFWVSMFIADFALIVGSMFNQLSSTDDWLCCHNYFVKRACPGMYTVLADVWVCLLPHIIYESIVAFQSLHNIRLACIDGAGRFAIWRLAYQQRDLSLDSMRSYLSQEPRYDIMAASFATYVMVGYANNEWCENYPSCLKTFSAKVQLWNQRVSQRSFGDFIHDFAMAIRSFQAEKPELFYFWEIETRCPLPQAKVKDASE